jgi:hypothetical protein
MPFNAMCDPTQWEEKHMPVFTFRAGKNFIFILFTIAALLSANPLAAQNDETAQIPTVIGSCPLKGNISKSRGCAISDALMDAVELAAMRLLPQSVMIKNFSELETVLYRRHEAFIRDYKVLSESTSGNAYRVLVQATVSSKKLRLKMINEGLAHDSGDEEMKHALIVSGADPATLPKTLSEGDFSNLRDIASSAIASALKRKGFRVSVKNSYPLFLEAKSADEKSVMDIGKRLEADLVATAEVTLRELPPSDPGRPYLYDGNLAIRAFSAKHGEEIGWVEKASEASHNLYDIPDLRDAISNAGSMAGEELSELILSSLEKQNERSIEMDVTVDEKIFFPYFVMLKKHLKDIPGILHVQTQEMMSNRAILSVVFRGNGEALAKALLKKKRQSFGLVIVETSPDRLRLTISSGKKRFE